MSAGTSRAGLGGLFFIFSALVAPSVELGRTARGAAARGRGVRSGRQFAIAMAMIAAVE